MIEEEEEDDELYETSMVRCDLCGYEWVAVRPSGIEKLQCPQCLYLARFENIETEEQ